MKCRQIALVVVVCLLVVLVVAVSSQGSRSSRRGGTAANAGGTRNNRRGGNRRNNNHARNSTSTSRSTNESDNAATAGRRPNRRGGNQRNNNNNNVSNSTSVGNTDNAATAGRRPNRRGGNRRNNNNNNNNNNAGNTNSTSTSGDSNNRNNRRNNRNNRRNHNRNNGTANATPSNRTTNGRSNNGQGGTNHTGDPHEGCEEIYIPMCKGMVPYSHTKLPNKFHHTNQLQVYRALLPLWAFMDHSCSRNLRYFICANYLPKCTRRQPRMSPCRRLCTQAKRKCNRDLSAMFQGFQWREKFPCRGLKNRRCLRPVREERCTQEHPTCISNSVLNVCANLTFNYGTLPNMFQQCNAAELNREMEYYRPLLETNCHQDLHFLLCGTHMPFCVSGGAPFSFPCREKCEEIKTACEPYFQRMYHNLPWPSKIQCHRFPATTSSDFQCVMPNEGLTFNGGK